MAKRLVMVTHARSHFSDELARALLKYEGAQIWGDDIRHAPTYHLGAHLDFFHPVSGEPTEFKKLVEERCRIIGIGVGGRRQGEEPSRYIERAYDEHPLEDVDAVDVEPTCEAMEVANHEQINRRPDLVELLDYGVAVDRKGEGKEPFQLGRLVEDMHDLHPNDEPFVHAWSELALRAEVNVRQPRGRRQPPRWWQPMEFFNDVFAKVLRAKQYDREVIGYVRSSAEDMRKKRDMRFTVLDTITSFLLTGTTDSRGAEEWLAEAIRARLERQVTWVKAGEDLREAQQIRLSGPGYNTLVFAESDNRHIGGRLRAEAPRAIAVMVRRSNNTVQIDLNTGDRGLHERVAATLRMREFEKRGLPVPSRDVLLWQQMPPGCPWFFFKRDWGAMLANGTLTRPIVSPTVLINAEILGCLTRGFDRSYRISYP